MSVPDHYTHTAWGPCRDVFWLTTNSQGGHTDHMVTQEAFATGSGTYTAICGSIVHPASMTVPPGPQCSRCLAYLEASLHQNHGRHQRHRSPHQPGWFMRMLGRQ